MLNTELLFRSRFLDMSLMPMGSLAWASNSRIAKHLSTAGTLLNPGFMMWTKYVPCRERSFSVSNGLMFVKRKLVYSSQGRLMTLAHSHNGDEVTNFIDFVYLFTYNLRTNRQGGDLWKSGGRSSGTSGSKRAGSPTASWW